jgi:hypothetical protein
MYRGYGEFFLRNLKWWSLIGLLAVAVSTSTGISLGQQGAWSQPVLMGPGWFPTMAADVSGRVHLAWASTMTIDHSSNTQGEEYSGYDVVMYASTDDGVEWDGNYDIMARKQSAGSEVTRPSFFADQIGILHMTYRDTTVYYSQAPVQQASVARSWRPSYPLSVDQVAYFSDIKVDSKGVVHAVFTENVLSPSCPICFRIYYRQSTDNGNNWSIRSDISNLPTGAAKPQLLVDDEDNLHLVWEAGRGGATGQLSDPTTVMYSASYDGGTTWRRALEFAVPDGRAKNITIGQDGRGNLVTAWLALPDDLIYYQVSTNRGRTWSNPEPIPNVYGGWAIYTARLDGYHMATDSAGNIQMVAVGRTSEVDETLSVLLLTWNGSSWSRPSVITSMTGDVPEWPRIAISNGNILNVTWFVRDEEHIFDSDQGEYFVWYSRGRSSAPAVEPVVLPSATSTTEPMTTPVPPTATPEPPDPVLRLTPIATDLSSAIYSEIDELRTIAASLIPAAIIVLVVVAFIRFRRS